MASALKIRDNGAVTYNDAFVGEFDPDSGLLELNAGWCRLAGLGIKIHGDAKDRRRVVFERVDETSNGSEGGSEE